LQKEDQTQWAAIQSIAGKIGCTHETLRRWVRQQERDQGLRAGLSSDDRERKRANDILRKASACFESGDLPTDKLHTHSCTLDEMPQQLPAWSVSPDGVIKAIAII